jgi:Ras-related protein Rab-5C
MSIKKYKISIIGDVFVGKSSIVHYLKYNKYHQYMESTIGSAYHVHKMCINNIDQIEMGIWDTAGQERYHSLTPLYVRDSNAIIFVYDLKDVKNLHKRLKYWFDSNAKNFNKNILFYIVGNKKDLAEHIDYISIINNIDFSDFEKYFDNKIKFIYTSSFTGENIYELFTDIGYRLSNNIYQPIENTEKINLLDNTNNNYIYGCSC